MILVHIFIDIHYFCNLPDLERLFIYSDLKCESLELRTNILGSTDDCDSCGICKTLPTT